MNVLHITIGENNTAKYLQIRKIIRNTMTAPCWWWTRNFGHIKTIAHSRRLWWFTQTHHAQIEWVSVIDRIKNAVELHPGSNYRVMHERWITSLSIWSSVLLETCEQQLKCTWYFIRHTNDTFVRLYD